MEDDTIFNSWHNLIMLSSGKASLNHKALQEYIRFVHWDLNPLSMFSLTVTVLVHSDSRNELFIPRGGYLRYDSHCVRKEVTYPITSSLEEHKKRGEFTTGEGLLSKNRSISLDEYESGIVLSAYKKEQPIILDSMDECQNMCTVFGAKCPELLSRDNCSESVATCFFSVDDKALSHSGVMVFTSPQRKMFHGAEQVIKKYVHFAYLFRDILSSD